MIGRGSLGEVLSADVYWRMSTYGPAHREQAGAWMRSLPGGVYQEVMPHLVYVTAAVMGRLEPFAVSVAGGDAGQAGELALLLASDRGPATMSLSLRSNPVRKVIRVKGSRGSLEIDLATSVLIHIASQADGTVARALVNLATAGQIATGTAANALRTALRRLPRGHETLIARFYAELREHGQPPVSGEDGLRTVAVLDRIWSLLPNAPSTGHPSSR